MKNNITLFGSSMATCHLAASSAMGKTYFFENTPGLQYIQPYKSTKGTNVKPLFVVDEVNGLVFVEQDWSTYPVKLSDLNSLERKIQIIEAMMHLLNVQWKVDYKYCDKILSISEVEDLFKNLEKLVFIGHTYNEEEPSCAVVAELELIQNRLKLIDSDHWFNNEGKHKEAVSTYHEHLLEKVRKGQLPGIEVTSVEGEFLIDLFESGELSNLVKGVFNGN